jgi:hypothetical protein
VPPSNSSRVSNYAKEIASLRRLGFSDYEAKAYLALLRLGRQTGYGLAKHSGVPRPNIYGVIDRLIERRAISKIQAPDGLHYQAVPIDELVAPLAKQHAADLARAADLLTGLPEIPAMPPAWQLEGRAETLAAANAVVQGAQRQLIVAVWPDEAKDLAPELAAAQLRGIDITTLCMAACAQECGGCPGRLYRCRAGALRDRRTLLIVADNREVVIADLHGQAVSAIRTQRSLVAALAGSFILQSILIGAILTDTAPTVLDQLARVHSEDILLDRARVQYAMKGDST